MSYFDNSDLELFFVLVAIALLVVPVVLLGVFLVEDTNKQYIANGLISDRKCMTACQRFNASVIQASFIQASFFQASSDKCWCQSKDNIPMMVYG